MRGIVKIYAAEGFCAFARLRPFHALVVSFLAQASVLKFYKIYASPRSAPSKATDRAPWRLLFERRYASVAIKFR